MSKKTYTIKIGSVRLSGKTFTKGQVIPADVKKATLENLLEKGYVNEFAPLSKPDTEPGIKISKKEVKSKTKPKTKIKVKPKEVVEEATEEIGDGIEISLEDLTEE